ncbi:MAG TPA: SBBP repeat-containing protein, partial [Thermoanaerobaculia bacterium]|nr:SBBP repeat-containing protein [Thermoanaerobaculia bacterium]
VTGTTTSACCPGTGGPPGGTEDAFVLKINATGTAIVYSTYLGGDAESLGYAIAVDRAGSAYVTGITSAANFPGTSTSAIQPALAGGEDAFVTKLDAAGSAIVYSTYLGGSGLDQGWGIAVDGAGNAYVAGLTESADFRGVSAASLQGSLSTALSGFVTKLNAAGSAIVYSTYLGGNNLGNVTAIAVDGSGSATVVGDTAATIFPGVTPGSIQPALAGEFDAFVTKLDPAGTGIVYSTFLGGAGEDIAQSVALDGAGNAYVAGYSTSSTFSVAGLHSIQPQSADATESGFVAKIDATGSTLVYLTFLGGSSTGALGNLAQAVAVDLGGNAYITGSTTSAAFPGVGPSSLQPTLKGSINAFLTQIDPQGTAIVYSTYLGGSGADRAESLAVDAGGNVYVGGWTTSVDFPVAGASPIQPALAGLNDAFLAKISMGMGFYTLAPCRLIDTRGTAGPLGGPSLQPHAQRTFAVTGTCGVPATARVLSVNVTITQPGAAGDLRLFPAGTAVPATSQVEFAAGQTRADSAMLLLGAAGFTVQLDSAAKADFILDVNGYYQ